jgi:hypothetical protein
LTPGVSYGWNPESEPVAHLEHPEWYPSFDLQPELSGATKRRILDRAVADKALVLAFHFPFPSLGYVIQQGKGWR